MEENEELLTSLALAVVNHPRASLQELAKAVGISKATLYRFCNTREQLIKRLLSYSNEVFNGIIKDADLKHAPPLDALRRLIDLNLEHRELIVFLIHYWQELPPDDEHERHWEESIDAFFLRGQQQGLFRIDITAAAMTEIWGGIVLGLVDAEQRGRIAKVGMANLIENVLLNGILPDEKMANS